MSRDIFCDDFWDSSSGYSSDELKLSNYSIVEPECLPKLNEKRKITEAGYDSETRNKDSKKRLAQIDTSRKLSVMSPLEESLIEEVMNRLFLESQLLERIEEEFIAEELLEQKMSQGVMWDATSSFSMLGSAPEGSGNEAAPEEGQSEGNELELEPPRILKEQSSDVTLVMQHELMKGCSIPVPTSVRPPSGSCNLSTLRIDAEIQTESQTWLSEAESQTDQCNALAICNCQASKWLSSETVALEQENTHLQQHCRSLQTQLESWHCFILTLKNALKAARLDNEELTEQVSRSSARIQELEADASALIEFRLLYQLSQLTKEENPVHFWQWQASNTHSTSVVQNALEASNCKVAQLQRAIEVERSISQLTLQESVDEMKRLFASEQSFTDAVHAAEKQRLTERAAALLREVARLRQNVFGCQLQTQ